MYPNPPTTRSLRPRMFAALAALALLGAACGDDDDAVALDDERVASIDDNGDTGDSESDVGSDNPGSDAADDGEVEAPENPEDAFELFDDCMADAGFDSGGSVVIGSGGGIEIDGDIDEGADPQDAGAIEDFDFEEFETANKACEGHLANVDSFADLSPEEQATFEDAQLEWETCMEEQGVEVPEFDGEGGSIAVFESEAEVDPQTGQPSFDDTDFQEFEEAAKACDHVFEDLGIGSGS